jgi:hypothetical protein
VSDPVNYKDPWGLDSCPAEYPCPPPGSGGGGGGSGGGSGNCQPLASGPQPMNAAPPCESGGGGGGPSEPTQHDLLRSAFDKVSDALRSAATASKYLSEHLVDCWAGMESAFDPHAVTGTRNPHEGLFQLNKAAWRDSGISAAFTDENVFDARTNAAAAIGYLSRLLKNIVGSEVYDNGDVSSSDISKALTDYRWGPYSRNKGELYATRIMDCAKALDQGSWDRAMTALGK